MTKKRYVLVILIVITVAVFMIFALRTHPFKNMDIHFPFGGKNNNSQQNSSDLVLNESYGLPYLEKSGKLIASFGEYEEHNETDYEFDEEEAEIIAISSGTVVKSGLDDNGGGFYITVEDVNGNFITYKHIESEEYLKKRGDAVNKGDLLTKAGASGNIAPANGKVMIAIKINAGSFDGEPLDFESLLE